jgi:hypothetical protein
MFHRKNSKDAPTSTISSASQAPVGTPLTPTTSALEPHKIHTINTVDELDQLLEDHHHRFVVVFCLTSHHKDPDVDEEGWYHHYERLNNMHFVRVNVDESEELEERLAPRVKPSWITFHRGHPTGSASGGMKKFIQAHSERRNSS